MSIRTRTQGRPPHPGGITLVEVLVALVLVAAGLLGIAGSSALMMRHANDADLARRAVRGASLRLAELSSSGCAGARGGTAGDSPLGPQERWTVTGVGASVRFVDLAVEWPGRGSRRRLFVSGAILC